MNFLFRGVLSVKERIGKSAILFLVMTAICVFVAAGFSIESATTKAGILARQKLGGVVTLTNNMEKMKEEMREGGGGFKLERNPISLEDINKVLSLENIAGYNLTSSTEGIADGFTPISGEEESSNTSSEMPFRGMENNRIMGDISIEGVSNLDYVSSFKDGENSIVSGEGINSNNEGEKVVLIEKTLADENDLKVGDKIKVTAIDDSDNTVELKVIGIYENTSEIPEGAMRNSAMNPYNKLYVPYKISNTLKGSDYKNKVDSAQFYLNDPINVDDFIKEGNKLDIDFNKYTLDANNRAYESMMKPIENIASFAKTTVLVVSIGGGIILGLIVILSIKERRNEIGILLSLGEGKSKIVAQFIVEVLIILSLSFASTAVIGNYVSGAIGNRLLQNEISTESSYSQNEGGFKGEMGGPMGGPNINNINVEKIDSLDVSVSGEDYLNMCGIGIIISLLGVLIPSITIMRLQPKEILSRHD